MEMIKSMIKPTLTQVCLPEGCFHKETPAFQALFIKVSTVHPFFSVLTHYFISSEQHHRISMVLRDSKSV